MNRLKFRDLPTSVKLATAVTGFSAWVLVEEFIIDRHQLDIWLPFYKVGNLCVYDLVVAAIIVGASVYWGRRTQ